MLFILPNRVMQHKSFLFSKNNETNNPTTQTTMKPQQKSAGEISLLNFILSHEKTSTAEIIKSNNRLLAEGLIPNAYPLRQKGKQFDEAFNLRCTLPSMEFDKLFNS